MKRTQHSAPAATDRRNVVDRYKGLSHQAIVADLDEHGRVNVEDGGGTSYCD